jgi:hypothetical protein
MKSFLDHCAGFRIGWVLAGMFGLLSTTTMRAADSSGSVSIIIPSTVQLPPPPLPVAEGDAEGVAVAGSSRFIVIGRPGRDVEYNGTNVTEAGQVVVWELDDGFRKRSWTIDAITPRASSEFGAAVAAGDRWIAVSHGTTRPNVPVHVTQLNRTNRVRLIEFPPDGGWLPGPDLSPTGAEASYATVGGDFGVALAMQGSRLVVGSSKAAFVYDVSADGVWSKTQRVDSPDNALWPGFGTAVAMSGDVLVVGAKASPSASSNGLFPGQGGACIYRKGGDGLYSFEKELRAANGNTNDGFGTSVAVAIRNDREWIAIGVPKKSPEVTPNSFLTYAGSVYLYYRNQPDGEWAFDEEIVNNSLQAQWGTRVAFSNGRLAVSAISSGGQLFPDPSGQVTFFAHDDDADTWIRTGNKATGGRYGRYGWGLAGFEYGFLIGIPGYSLTYGNWEWRVTDPYLGFINQAGGPFLVDTSAQKRSRDVDPDGDGLINGDELFFGSDPLVAETNRVIAPVIDSASKQFKLQWQQAAETYGLTAKVAWSTNILGGDWVTNDLQIVSLGTVTNSTAKRYEARLSTIGRTNVFFRLLVE